MALVRVEFVSIAERAFNADSAKALAFQATVRLRCPTKWQGPTLRSCFFRVRSRGCRESCKRATPSLAVSNDRDLRSLPYLRNWMSRMEETRRGSREPKKFSPSLEREDDTNIKTIGGCDVGVAERRRELNAIGAGRTIHLWHVLARIAFQRVGQDSDAAVRSIFRKLKDSTCNWIKLLEGRAGFYRIAASRALFRYRSN